MSTSTLNDVEIDPLTGQGRVTHIIKQRDNKTAAALVMESRVDGIELEALCGHRFVAGRDPKQYPVCQACEEVYFSKVERGEGMPDE